MSAGDVEFLIGASLEVSLNGDSRRIGVDDSGRLCFSVGSFPQHGPEDRVESCLSKLIQAMAKCMVVEIVWLDPIVKEVLSVCSL